jgi:hypothetical protein
MNFTSKFRQQLGGCDIQHDEGRGMRKRMTFRWGECFEACKHSFSATEIAELLTECQARIAFAANSVFEGKYHGPSRITLEMFGCTFYLDLQPGEREWVLRVVHVPPGKKARKRRSDARDVSDSEGGEGAGAAMPAGARGPRRRTAKRVLSSLYKSLARAMGLFTGLLYQTGENAGLSRVLLKIRVPAIAQRAMESLRLSMKERFSRPVEPLTEPVQLVGGAWLEPRLVGAHIGIPLVVSTFVAIAAPAETARMNAAPSQVTQESQIFQESLFYENREKTV